MTTCVLANHLTGNVLAAKIVSRISRSQVKSAWKHWEISTPSTSVALGIALELIVKKGEINCSKLIDHSVKIFLTKFVPVCQGIKGTIGELVVDKNYIPEPCEFPIDTLVLTINQDLNEDDENEVKVELDGE